mmetsp:Transcript_35926/g.143605  ORF Transcript_35926/g.143605 Transcript_35926/m.143605 type:complete len:236 (+) Transcript_35926:1932-2639(+)
MLFISPTSFSARSMVRFTMVRAFAPRSTAPKAMPRAAPPAPTRTTCFPFNGRSIPSSSRIRRGASCLLRYSGSSESRARSTAPIAAIQSVLYPFVRPSFSLTMVLIAPILSATSSTTSTHLCSSKIANSKRNFSISKTLSRLSDRLSLCQLGRQTDPELVVTANWESLLESSFLVGDSDTEAVEFELIERFEEFFYVVYEERNVDRVQLSMLEGCVVYGGRHAVGYRVSDDAVHL